MSLPVIQVRVAFASDPFDAAPVWTDITHDVQSITTKRGRQTELARMEAGTATIRLKNHQGNYWPNNAAGAYFPNVLPGKKVNIRGSYGELGYSTIGGTPGTAVDNIRAARITPTISCKVNSFFVFNASSGAGFNPKLKGAVYSSALALGVQTAEVLPVTGWQELILASEVELIAGIDYWFAVWADVDLGGDVFIFWDAIATPDLGTDAQAYGAWPDPLVPANANSQLSLYMVPTYDLYTGFAAGWPPKWLSKTGGLNPVVTIKCVDLTKNLSNFDLNTVGYAQELSGTRVGNVLDDIGWPAGLRAIDVGQSNMIASGAIADEKAMTHLFLVQDTELGIIYIAGDGDVVFEDRKHRMVAPHTVSQATFGDDLGENYYSDLEPEYDDEFIYNDVRITRDGGAAQQVSSDAASVLAYGTRTYSKTGLLMTTDAEALDHSGYKLRLYKDPLLRARSLLLKGERDPARLWPMACGFDISTRITVRNNEASIDEDYFIEGVSHQIDVQNQTWETSWQLSNATGLMFWILGVAGYTEMGETTHLGY